MVLWAIRFVAAAWILLGAVASAQTVSIERSETNGTLDILWPGVPAASWERQGTELVLRFGRAVEALDLGDIQRRLSRWIESASAGYDTVLLRMLPGVIVDIRAAPGSTRIALSGTASGDPAAARRLEQLRARLEAESGQTAAAEARLSALARAQPTDPDIMVQRAGLAEKQGRWPKALGLYDQALGQRPDDGDLREARRRLARERQSQVKVEPEYQRVHGADRQWMLKASAFHYPDEGRTAGTAVEIRRLSDGNLRRLDGSSAPASLWREKAELYYGIDVGASALVTGRLLATNRTPGAGIEWSDKRSDVDLKFGAAYREAYWDIKEAIPADATVDKVYARAQAQLGEALSFNGGAALNRYGVEDDVDVARTAKWDVGVRRGLRLWSDEASIGYSIDAESVGHRETRRSAAGVGYRTLPVRSRETHSFDLTLRHEFAFESWLAGQIGWSVDRLTDAKGPLGNLKLSHEPSEHVETGFKIGFAHTTGRGSDGLSRQAGAYLTVRF